MFQSSNDIQFLLRRYLYGGAFVILNLITAPISYAQRGVDVNNFFHLAVSASQSSSSNWYEGGEQNFLSIKSQIKLQNHQNFSSVILKSVLLSNLGIQHNSGTDDENPYRVGDNEFFSEIVATYPLGWKIDPYLSGSIRTPITESFQYTPTTRKRMGNLWDPVTTQESMGFTSHAGPSNNIILRIGVGLKQIRARHNTQLSDDPRTAEVKEAYKAESGIEYVAESTLTLDSNITYAGRLDLFGTFKTPDVWTVRFKSELQVKVWKFIAVLFGIYINHDIKQTLRTQFRQSLTLGVVQTF